jgi:hypothetical protein
MAVRIACLLVLVAGCATLKEKLAESKATEAAIQSELGLQSQISFRTFATKDGAHTVVQVKLASTPPGDVAELKAKIEAIVRAHFTGTVDNVSLAM